MLPLAYYHHHVVSWLAYTVARSLIYRVVWRATAGMPLLELGGLTIAALVVLVLVLNRRA